MSVGFPKANECLNRDACRFENFTTVCTYPYKGFLCADCLNGYFSNGYVCKLCPSKNEKAINMLIAAFLVLVMSVIVVALVWVKSNKEELNRILSKAKIGVNYYYNCSKIFEVMSFVQWPTTISNMINFLKALELNPITLLSLKCWFIRFSLYHNYILFATINGCIVATTMLGLMFIKLRYWLGSIGKKQFKRARRSLISVSFFFIFLIYPLTSVSIVQLLPLACKEYYLSFPDNHPVSYFMQDTAMRCFTPQHNRMLPPVYLSLIYVLGIPIGTPILVWYLRRKLNREAKLSLVPSKTDRRRARKERVEGFPLLPSSDNIPDVEDKIQENISIFEDIYVSLHFFYGNYHEKFFFWESLEMSRKLFLASVAVFIGKTSRTVLALVIMVSGLSGVSHAHFNPIASLSEHILQLTCLSALFCILLCGLSMKMESSDDFPFLSSKEEDELGLTVALIFCTVIVAVILLGE